jgi:hypothetical protein
VLLLVLYSCFFSIGQERFNLRYNSGLESTILTNVIENELGYICTGFMGDGVTNARPMLISQFDFSGNELWNNHIGGAEFDIEYQVIQSSNSDIFKLDESTYVHSGQTRDWDGWSQGYIMKTDQVGDTIQMIRFYSPYFEGFPYESSFISTQFVTLASDSTFLVSSNITGDETSSDFMVQKISQEGEILWRYDYATEQDSESNHFIIPNDHGGCLVFPTVFEQPNNYNKIIGIDSLGDEEFQLSINQGFYTGSIKDALSTEGHYILLTSLGNDAEDLEVIPGIVKIDLQGEEIWKTRFWNFDDSWQSSGGLAFKWGEQLVHTADGHYAAMGFNAFADDSCYTQHAWLGKIGQNGTKQWTRYYSVLSEACNRHQLYDMRETSDGGFIMCGQSRDYTGESDGEFQEGWLLKVDEHGCLVEGCHLSDNIEELSTSTEYFKAGPVPARDFLNIYQTKALDNSFSYQLHDMNGNLVENFPAADFQTTFMLPVHEYVSGTYVLSLMENGKVLQSEKIVFSGF